MTGTNRDSILEAKRTNIDRFRQASRQRQAKVENTPLEIFLEISNTCNIRCKMCATIWHGPNRFMEKEVFESAYPLFQNALMLHPFGFGEPLLHKNFKEIVAAAKAQHVYVDFFTNGALLDADMTRFLISEGIDRVVLSFDGAKKETYEAIHRGARYERVVENMRFLASQKRRLLRSKPELAFNLVVMRCNFEELPQLLELGASWDLVAADVKSLVTYDFLPEMEAERKYYEPERDQAIIKRCREIARRHNISLSLDQFFSSAAREVELLSEDEMISAHLKKYIEAANGGPYCLEPFRTIYVKSDGNVKPCCFQRDFDFLGNVREQTLSDIWAGERFARFRQRIIDNEIPKACIPCVRDFHKPMGDKSDDIFSLVSRPDTRQVSGTVLLRTFLRYPFERSIWQYIATEEFRSRAKAKLRRMMNIV